MPKDVEKVDLKKPQEMAYVFSGAYTPISCRLVEQVSALPGHSDTWSANVCYETICMCNNVELFIKDLRYELWCLRFMTGQCKHSETLEGSFFLFKWVD